MNKLHPYLLNENNRCKQELYSLFDEITAKVKRTNTNIIRRDFSNNVSSIKMSQLINYIKEMMNILLHQKSNDLNNLLFATRMKLSKDEAMEYEIMLQHYEANERKLIRQNYILMTIREIHQNRLKKYYQMEKEFIEMKSKFKYEESRFWREERKDNEVIIIRAENGILKKTIADLEAKCNMNDKAIKELNDTISELRLELIEIKKDVNGCNQKINNDNNNWRCNCCKLSFNGNQTAKASFVNNYTSYKIQSQLQLNRNSKCKCNCKTSKSMLNRSNNITLDVINNEAPLSNQNRFNKLKCSMNKIFDLTQKRALYYNTTRLKHNKTQQPINLYSMRVNDNFNKHQSMQTNRTSRYNNNDFISKRSRITLSRLALSKSLTSGMNLSFINKSNSKGEIDHY